MNSKNTKINNLDINEKSYLLGICFWLKRQPEAKDMDMTDENCIFYHVAPMTYAKLILRFFREQEQILKSGQPSIFSSNTNKSFDRHDFALQLKDKYAESLVDDDAGEDDPFNWWLQDTTVEEITDFVEEYLKSK